MFKPSTYKINLSSEFLQGLQDGEILLKFHFWSGETIEYTLIKDGDIIKGISSQSDSNLSSDDGPGIDDTTHNGKAVEDIVNQKEETMQSIDLTGNQRNDVAGVLTIGIFVAVMVVFLVFMCLRKSNKEHIA